MSRRSTGVAASWRVWLSWTSPVSVDQGVHESGGTPHNLVRWTQLIGLPATTVRAARTLRRRLLQVAGRLTRHGRRWILHLPARWPWQGDYIAALARIRALPAPC